MSLKDYIDETKLPHRQFNRRTYRKALEERHGAVLDAMTTKDKLELLRRAEEADLKLVIGLRRKLRYTGVHGLGRIPLLSIIDRLDG